MSGATEAQAPKKQSSAKTLIGTSVGNALEWYDWNVYGSFAVYFSAQLFDTKNSAASDFMYAMVVFAVGFVARPFGSAFFGWLADRLGRKTSLIVTVVCASGGSLLIAICPTYSHVGIWASVLLMIARLVQGLAHGGELPSAQTYLTEVAPPKRRGLWTSAIYVTGTIGNLFGLVLGLILSETLSTKSMDAYGWRIPFALGAVLGVVAFWIRIRLSETDIFEEQAKKPKQHNLAREVLSHWRVGLQVIGMTCGLTVGYYIWSVSTVSVAKANLGYSANSAFVASIIGNVVFMISLPFWGMFSDRFGRKINMLIAMVGCAILYIPLSKMVSSGNEMWRLALVMSIMLILLGAYLAIAPAAYGELFPTNVRATAFGIPYAIAVALFGGTAPYVMSALNKHPNVFVGYVIVLLVISAVTIITLKETKDVDLRAAR